MIFATFVGTGRPQATMIGTGPSLRPGRLRATWLVLVLVFVFGAIAGALTKASADVVRVEILERTAFAQGRSFGRVGRYEKLRGRLHYAIDPKATINRAIVDLEFAPRNAQGLVEFSGDFLLLRPSDPTRGNRTLLFDVTNRGNLTALSIFNSERSGNNPASAGNGFLMRKGFTLLAAAWNWDVPPGNDRLMIDLPVARDKAGGPLTGRIAYEFEVERPTRTAFVGGISARGHPLADNPAPVLTVRDAPEAVRRVIPPQHYRLTRRNEKGDEVASNLHVTADFDFLPGRIYELIVSVKDPRVVGLGLAAIRDAIRWARDDAASMIDRAVIFGHSQSARLIATMVRDGLFVDEHGAVFEGAYLRVAGGGKGSFNFRFAQTTRHFSQFEEHIYPTDEFPFSTAPSVDPVTGRRASLLDRALALGFVPKIFFTNTSTEYWSRAASLLHTTADGRVDLVPDPRSRIYALLGTQHFFARWKTPRMLEYCVNPVDKRPVARALLLALTRWVETGESPPANRYPTIARGELGNAPAYLAALPRGFAPARPQGFLIPPRLDFGARFRTSGIMDLVPPKVVGHYRTLVPMPRQDGNDQGGAPLPWIEAPLGTHLGFNPRNPAHGGHRIISRWLGSFIPFARSRAERFAALDPRPSLEERYGDRAGYERAFSAAVDRAIAAGFLLAEERAAIIADQMALYDRVMARALDGGCGYLSGETS